MSDESKRWAPSGFAGRLKELRERAGLTQVQLAERAGCHPMTLAKLERGVHEPAWPLVLTLARALGVEVAAFVVEGQPAAAIPAPPGRPRKPPVEDAGPPQPKRPRGRPRKASGTAQDRPSQDKATSAPSEGKKPTEGQGRKRKG